MVLLLAGIVIATHRPLSSSFLGLPYRILTINHKNELLRRLPIGSVPVSSLSK